MIYLILLFALALELIRRGEYRYKLLFFQLVHIFILFVYVANHYSSIYMYFTIFLNKTARFS